MHLRLVLAHQLRQVAVDAQAGGQVELVFGGFRDRTARAAVHHAHTVLEPAEQKVGLCEDAEVFGGQQAAGGQRIEHSGDGRIRMAPEVMEATDALRTYLFAEVYPHPAIRKEVEKAKKLLEDIYCYVLEHSAEFLEPAGRDEPAARLAVDFVAGMTDRYALTFYEKQFMPEPWRVV